jgi:haloacetate dehalogenase
MFDGFTHHDLMTERGTLHAVVAGDGPPLLLLHGFPETHLMWHGVAPALAPRFTVVVPDLPGYGDSLSPEPAEDHSPHSKRAMAGDLVAAMATLGYDRFALAGHDRGGRVGYRMALDFPDTLTALAVLDIVPTAEVWARADDRFALAYWWWGLLAQPAPLPEEMVLAAPHETFFDHHLTMIARRAAGYPPEITGDYLDRVENPMLVRAMCEDYRAGATIDRDLDEADRSAGRRIACPLLVLWGAQGALPNLYEDVLGIWRAWADDVRGEALDAGHYIPEDLPDETAAALDAFFTSTG